MKIQLGSLDCGQPPPIPLTGLAFAVGALNSSVFKPTPSSSHPTSFWEE